MALQIDLFSSSELVGGIEVACVLACQVPSKSWGGLDPGTLQPSVGPYYMSFNKVLILSKKRPHAFGKVYRDLVVLQTIMQSAVRNTNVQDYPQYTSEEAQGGSCQFFRNAMGVSNVEGCCWINCYYGIGEFRNEDGDWSLKNYCLERRLFVNVLTISSFWLVIARFH